MGRRGPKPKPPELEVLQGKPGHRPINPDYPKPQHKFPSPPSFLSLAAKKEWRRLRRILVNVPFITEVDRSALAVYCDAWSRYSKATEQLRTGLLFRPKDKEGKESTWPVWNPYLSIQKQAIRDMMGAAAELGLTPSSRGRVQATATANEDDEIGGFLDQARA